MKTIKQWFEGYPDHKLRAKLLYNWEHHKFDGKHHKYSSFEEALEHGFKWEDTPEGYLFWEILWHKALENPLDEYPI